MGGNQVGRVSTRQGSTLIVIHSCLVFQNSIFLSAQAELQIKSFDKTNGFPGKAYTVDATPHQIVIAGSVTKPNSGTEQLKLFKGPGMVCMLIMSYILWRTRPTLS